MRDGGVDNKFYVAEDGGLLRVRLFRFAIILFPIPLEQKLQFLGAFRLMLLLQSLTHSGLGLKASGWVARSFPSVIIK